MISLLATQWLCCLVIGMGSQVATYGNADIIVTNDTKEKPGLLHVRSTGKIPLQLEITENGDKEGRKLRVFVTIFERAEPTRLKAGKFVKEYLDPQVFTPQQVENNVMTLDSEIKIAKGEYIMYVFLIDPDQPFRGSPQALKLAGPAKIPGEPRRIKTVIAHVE